MTFVTLAFEDKSYLKAAQERVRTERCDVSGRPCRLKVAWRRCFSSKGSPLAPELLAGRHIQSF